ncbi:hypothetical protein CTAYLR_005994 [Chrysophaeum taylorii]|uniref:Uncharacterized protein n=1 Tax=Chrysophaeum taylorii TaxID=2483200 RepID=A0AAD7XGD3_9STRA|nr:hypothetical protein CTAYLR_005994 [Chrysophaeum taylorii]
MESDAAPCQPPPPPPMPKPPPPMPPPRPPAESVDSEATEDEVSSRAPPPPMPRARGSIESVDSEVSEEEPPRAPPMPPTGVPRMPPPAIGAKPMPQRPPPPPAYVPKFEEAPLGAKVPAPVDIPTVEEEEEVPADAPAPKEEEEVAKPKSGGRSSTKRIVSTRVQERQAAMFGEKKEVQKTKIEVSGGGVAARLAALKKNAAEHHAEQQPRQGVAATGGGVKERLASLQMGGFDLEKLATRAAGGGWHPPTHQKVAASALPEEPEGVADLRAKQHRLESQVEHKRRQGDDVSREEAELAAIADQIAKLEHPDADETPRASAEEPPRPSSSDHVESPSVGGLTQQRATVRRARRPKTVKRVEGEALVQAVTPTNKPAHHDTPDSTRPLPEATTAPETAPEEESVDAPPPTMMTPPKQQAPAPPSGSLPTPPVFEADDVVTPPAMCAASEEANGAATPPPPMPAASDASDAARSPAMPPPIPSQPAATPPDSPATPPVAKKPLTGIPVLPATPPGAAAPRPSSGPPVADDEAVEERPSSLTKPPASWKAPPRPVMPPPPPPTPAPAQPREADPREEPPREQPPENECVPAQEEEEVAKAAPGASSKGGFMRRLRKTAAATTGVRGVFSTKKKKKDFTVEEAAAAVEALGGTFVPIAAKMRQARIDGPFLRTLSKTDLDETFADLGAVDRLSRRRLAYELGLDS